MYSLEKKIRKGGRSDGRSQTLNVRDSNGSHKKGKTYLKAEIAEAKENKLTGAK